MINRHPYDTINQAITQLSVFRLLLTTAENPLIKMPSLVSDGLYFMLLSIEKDLDQALNELIDAEDKSKSALHPNGCSAIVTPVVNSGRAADNHIHKPSQTPEVSK
jgi:hypothetical protein